ncbi:9792_t:CDS:2, partial [Ambispora leptoticha]
EELKYNESDDEESIENSGVEKEESDSDAEFIFDNSIKKKSPSASEGTTLFIRNLPFEATKEELHDVFSSFGPLQYCVLTMDNDTGRSRGTGFVCFKELKDANHCLEEAEKLQMNLKNETTECTTVTEKNKRRNELQFRSILMPDTFDRQAEKFTLHGRVLSVVRAVEREQAKKLKEQNQDRKRREDRRNIYLMKEGVIFPDTPAAASLTPSEVTKRATSYSLRKNLLAKNPNLFLSKTRLSVRNLPLSVDERQLKALGKESIIKFKEQAKIVRSKDRIDLNTIKPRSKGYGFLEFTHHAHALAALRYLNNNPKLFGDKKRLIVEFAVENNIILKKRLIRNKNPGSITTDNSNNHYKHNLKNNSRGRKNLKRKPEDTSNIPKKDKISKKKAKFNNK